MIPMRAVIAIPKAFWRQVVDRSIEDVILVVPMGSDTVRLS
jgi:hypothetical protein